MFLRVSFSTVQGLLKSMYDVSNLVRTLSHIITCRTDSHRNSLPTQEEETGAQKDISAGTIAEITKI